MMSTQLADARTPSVLGSRSWNIFQPDFLCVSVAAQAWRISTLETSRRGTQPIVRNPVQQLHPWHIYPKAGVDNSFVSAAGTRRPSSNRRDRCARGHGVVFYGTRGENAILKAGLAETTLLSDLTRFVPLPPPFRASLARSFATQPRVAAKFSTAAAPVREEETRKEIDDLILADASPKLLVSGRLISVKLGSDRGCNVLEGYCVFSLNRAVSRKGVKSPR